MYIDLNSLLLDFSLFALVVAFLYKLTIKSVLPYVVWVLLTGLLYALVRPVFLGEGGRFILEPSLVFHLFLPLLVFETSLRFKLEKLSKAVMPISFLGVVGVLMTAGLMGVVIARFLGIPPVHGLFLGAIIAATDPVAVAAIFEKFKLPQGLKDIVEGESLMNDAVVILAFAGFSLFVFDQEVLEWWDGILLLMWSFLGSAVFGVLYGGLLGRLVHRWQCGDLIELMVTLALAWSSFLIVDEFLFGSGVISTVFAAIFYLRTKNRLTGQEQQFVKEMWKFFGLVANSALFFLMGVTMIETFSFWDVRILGVVILLFLARAIVVYGGGFVLDVTNNHLPMSWQNVINFAGLRGAVALALVLSVPQDYIYQQEFLSITAALVLTSLVVYPLLMHAYLWRVKIHEKG